MLIRITITFLLFSLIQVVPSKGQNIENEHFEAIKPRNIGPAGMSGRITAIDVDLSDKDRIFVGAASGGVWLSESGGVEWEPIFDDQPTLSIGALKINQKIPSEIWVGTGEGNPRNSHNSGAGIFKSIDGGKSWSTMGLEKTKVIHRIIIHRDNPNIVFAGATGSAWGANPERGVYKTIDGGKSWKKVLYVNDKTGVADMVVDPTNPNKLIVAMWEYGRTPWDFVSGGKGSGLYITYDGGENWKKITSEEGLPKGELGRIGLAIAPSKPDLIYALIEAEENGLYKSTDGGEKWTMVSKKNIGNRPFYYSELYVDPQNENRIYNLWSYVSKSEDGGKTFETIMDYGNNVHPDHHAFWIDPDDPNYLINGNDGGLNISRDRAESWQFIGNIPVGQFYHVNIDSDYPYHVMGGMQDNGSWLGQGFVLKSGGIRNYDWQEIKFGDGFDVALRPDDNRFAYAMSQGGNLAYVDRQTGQDKVIKPTHPEAKPLRYNWNAAFAQDPFNDCGIYYGSQYVHKSMDCGETWEIISPDLTTNDTLKQKQDKSGGLTIDATNAENHTTILCIAPSPLDANLIWVGTDDGNLHVSTDGGQNWTNQISRLPGCPKGVWIPQIHVSNKDKNEVFVVVNNYRKNDWSAYLYHTQNGGKSWKRIANDNSIKGFVCSVIQDPEESNLVFLGTDIGLYYSLNRGTSWEKWGKGIPSVQIRDMKIESQTKDLVLGTFGRAFWIVDDIGFLRNLASQNNIQVSKDFAVFDTPDAYLAKYRSYDGIRFIAQGEFVGQNKRYGAMITFWNKPADKEKDKEKIRIEELLRKDKGDKKKIKEKKPDKEMMDKKKKKKDKKVKIVILDSNQDTVRSFNRDVKDGLNRIYWGLERKGVRFPSRNDPRPDQGEPRGVSVLPGNYKIVLDYKGNKDSTLVSVKKDPRTTQSLQDLKDINQTIDNFYKVVEKATAGFDQLKDAKKSIGTVDKILVNQPDSIKKQIIKLNKETKKSIDDLMELYMMPSGLKGIQGNPNSLNSVLRTASRYIRSSWAKPNQNVLNTFERAENETKNVLDQINDFFETNWKDYMDRINQLEIKIFKEREKLGLE